MFRFLVDMPYCDKIRVILSLQEDMRECVAENKSLHNVLVSYINEFPQFYKTILRHYKEIRKDNFEIEQQKTETSIVPKSRMVFIVSNDEFQDAVRRRFYRLYLLSHPYGKMLLEMEDRILYLDKYYISQKLGFEPPLKDW